MLCIAWHSDIISSTARDVPLFFVVLSPEPFIQLAQSLPTGVESQQAIRSSIAEGVIEAPASALLTLYPSMILSAVSDDGPEALFLASVLMSFLSITRCSTKLHFDGQSSSFIEQGKNLFLEVPAGDIPSARICFLRLPHPTNARLEMLKEESMVTLVWVFIALELVQNAAILQAISADMHLPVASILAATMVVGRLVSSLHSMRSRERTPSCTLQFWE